MLPMILCVNALYVATACSVGIQPDAGRELELLRAGWPTSGVLLLEFKQESLGPEWLQEIGFDFATRSWRLLFADGHNESMVRTPNGEVLRGSFRLKPEKETVADLSAVLDPYMPSFQLAGLLDHPGAFVGADRSHPDEIRFEFMLPNGQRIQSLAQLPPAAIEMWGGKEKILKKVVFVTDAQHKPLRLLVENRPDEVFDLANSGTGAFTLAGSVPGPWRKLR